MGDRRMFRRSSSGDSVCSEDDEETSPPAGWAQSGRKETVVAWRWSLGRLEELVEMEDREEDKRENARAIIQSAEGPNCHERVAPGWRRRR